MPAFAQLVEEVHDIVDDELGDTVQISDGVADFFICPGFFRRTFEEVLSEKYGFTQEANTFECRASRLQGLNLESVGTRLKLTFQNKSYTVMDIRYDTHVSALLVLSR